MPSDDQVLELLARGSQMNYAEWPGLLERILPRLEHIAYRDFPLPRIPIQDFVPSSQEEENISARRERSIKSESQEEPLATTKEESSKRDKLDDRQGTPTKDAPSTAKSEHASKSPPSKTITPPPNTLPPPLLSLLHTIQSTLSTSFPTSPPHTAQRLAELILHPTSHYRTLPSYLRALDRIVSVASPASIFPLPDLIANTGLNGRMPNGASSPSPDPTSEENFIGGAELTEIPWLRHQNTGSPSPTASLGGGTASDLRTESKSLIDGPNGAGSVETVTVNVNGGANHPSRSDDSGGHGITQGELLRQEQEAGIVPVPSSPQNGRVTRSSAASAAAAASRAVGLESEEGETGVDEDPEPVHARGPGVIGMEDMGPQAPGSGLAAGLDLEGALGRRGEGETMARAVGRPVEGEEGGGDKDGDGDVVVADADGVVEGEEEGGASEANRGADAVD